MPVDDRANQKSLGWPVYIGIGCGLCLILIAGAFIGFQLWMRHKFTKHLNAMINPAPLKPTGPYKFGYPQAADVSIQLPDGRGQLTYIHYLISPRNEWGGEGTRGLRLSYGGTTQDWPLRYSHLRNVRVGVYWYPAKAGKGPYLRFSDATGESALDLRRGEVGMLQRTNGRAYMADYVYNANEFRSPMVASSSSGGVTTVTMTSANGKPAEDVTSIVSQSNCRYLGSIVQSGNKLQFVPARSGR